MKEGENITILILGDEGAGKSSLASTFVSRHFSGRVPGLLTRVRLPPDPSLSNCATTIVDTQGGDAALRNALSLGGGDDGGSFPSVPASNADSISSLGKSLGGAGGGAVAAGSVASKGSVSAEGRGENRRDSSVTTSSSKEESAAAHSAATSPFRGVDAIILVYDLGRIETFHRLEGEWLPLLERCYNGDVPVIVAGNKMDSARAAENSPTRQQIISLLRRFKFVRQCAKCSARELRNVDEVFLKAQQSVLYPICPLYDLSAGSLSPACERAFARIFRAYMDGDGLLSDAGLNAFQRDVWGVSLGERDFAGWKETATRHGGRSGSGEGGGDDDVVRDGKFTLSGFLAIFDFLITSRDRLEVPWKVLRTLGYDDELNLDMPASISPPGGEGPEFARLHPDDWRLSGADVDFLTSIFVLFDSDGDGTLSSEDIRSIFSVISSPHPPWGERGSLLFKDCFSLPCTGDEETPPASLGDDLRFDDVTGSPPTSHSSSPSSRISAGGITISSSPLPSVDISKDSESLSLTASTKHEPLSFLSWINRWHMICTISPSIARAEMYRLGRNFERKSPMILNAQTGSSRVAPHVSPANDMPSTFVRALVLGSTDSGKSVLVKKLHRLQHLHGNDAETECPATSSSVSQIVFPKSCGDTQGEEILVHVILTEVPALDVSSHVKKRNLRNELAVLLGQEESGKRPYDMALLVFDTANTQSLEFAKDLESNVLTEDMPRVYAGTTSGSETSNNEADEHCKCMDLEPPLYVSLHEGKKLDPSVIERLASCARDDRRGLVSFRSTPHGERKRRNAAKRRKALWIGGLVTAGITVVLGLSFTRKRKMASEKGGWLRFLKNLLPFQKSETCTPTFPGPR